MRLTTLYKYQQIIRLYQQGKREPKNIAELLHITVDVVYRALRNLPVVSRETSTVLRRKKHFNLQNFPK